MIDDKASSFYFLKVQVEDVGNSLDASSSDLTIIKVGGNPFFLQTKRHNKCYINCMLNQCMNR